MSRRGAYWLLLQLVAIGSGIWAGAWLFDAVAR